MKIHCGRIGIIVFFMCIVYSSCTKNKQKSLVLSKYECNFGKVRHGVLCADFVKLYNKGKKDIRVSRVGGDCGCTTVLIDKRIIVPGDSTVLHFSLDTKEKIGKIENYIIIEANTDSVVHYVRLLATVE